LYAILWSVKSYTPMTRKNNLEIDIAVRSPKWPSLEPIIRDVAFKTLEVAKYKKPVELSVVLADDIFVQNLNYHYRGKDKPTNVLAFPAEDPVLLGDVVLAYETVKKESMQSGRNFEHHVMHLIIHGILHLLGHDHEDDSDADTMESIEIRILRSFGVKNPYDSED
jgi:probable rRNA maturation factor